MALTWAQRWLNTSAVHVLEAQTSLLQHFVQTPLTSKQVVLPNGEVINCVDTDVTSSPVTVTGGAQGDSPSLCVCPIGMVHAHRW